MELKPMKVRKVGKHLTKSFSEWKEYIDNNRQYATLKKELPKVIGNLQDTLRKLNDKFLGKYNLFHDVSFLRKKTKEIYEKSKRFINIKEY
tara:strand:- start:232 stop:504 length:273 start_codon:yes stop_codon:yes gene_type:complete